MNKRLAGYFLLVLLGCMGAGCANISTPTGGKRDKTPPKLLKVTPADSLRNTRLKRVELDFDEYVTVGDAQTEFTIMPLLTVAPTLTGVNKHVVVKIVDSLLEDNTTYRLTFGKAIKDVHEGNPFGNYTYTFSTGSYFDSLSLKGTVTDAATGLRDSTGVIVVLYSAKDNDSAVIKKKPKYMTKAASSGDFEFKGLPARGFRIYAIKDANTNLIYDGDPDMVAFNNSDVVPARDSAVAPIALRLFGERPDTATLRKRKEDPVTGKGLKRKAGRDAVADTNFTYTNNLDTASLQKRSFDINNAIKLSFNRLPVIASDRITLTYDSAGVTVTPPVTITTDTLRPNQVQVRTAWAENKVYRLRLAAGFARDTAGRELPAARFTFRTNNEDDYGKIKVVVPARYVGKATGPDYLMLVKADDDTAYYKPITDSVVSMPRLRPGNYTFRIVVDDNHNGIWDTGDLLGRRQPEVVIPSAARVKLKTGFDHTIDFEEAVKAKPGMSDKKDRMKDVQPLKK